MSVDATPDVSVCVTTYQHARFIRRCLESVLAQRFRGRLEVLVGDDGSMDGTRDIISELANCDDRVRPMFHVRNLGPAGNLNALVQLARGRAIAHLDGDDEWNPGKLAAQCAVLDADHRAVAVYTNATLATADDRPLGLFNAHVPVRIDLRELLRRGNFLNHSSILYRASAREAVLGMRPPWIDYRLHIRLCRLGALAYVDTPYVTHRWRTSGSMIRTMPRAVCDGQFDAFEEALRAGADPADVRAAAGNAWSKVIVHGIAVRDLSNVRYFARRLSDLPDVGASATWRMQQTLLAPLRALYSWKARRSGVFFP